MPGCPCCPGSSSTVTVCCCPSNPITKSLTATVNWTPTGLCVYCSPPINLTLTYYAAGTGPLGSILLFQSQAYWYGCVTCGTKVFALVLYCENSPNCTWFMGTTCFANGPCPQSISSGLFNVSANCNPFSVTASDASCCGAGNSVSITIQE